MDVATIHTVGPGDIISEHGQHAVYVPRVKAIVDAFKDFDVIVHGVSPLQSAGADAAQRDSQWQRWLIIGRGVMRSSPDWAANR